MSDLLPPEESPTVLFLSSRNASADGSIRGEPDGDFLCPLLDDGLPSRFESLLLCSPSLRLLRSPSFLPSPPRLLLDLDVLFLSFSGLLSLCVTSSGCSASNSSLATSRFLFSSSLIDLMCGESFPTTFPVILSVCSVVFCPTASRSILAPSSHISLSSSPRSVITELTRSMLHTDATPLVPILFPPRYTSRTVRFPSRALMRYPTAPAEVVLAIPSELSSLISLFVSHISVTCVFPPRASAICRTCLFVIRLWQRLTDVRSGSLEPICLRTGAIFSRENGSMFFLHGLVSQSFC
mmetsp:Transcript_16135/g.37258  ORF Transcript_16135/g.37258 Transcript_16135/m.37258 type:complete len:295 (+) Transcript_16135:199-1083(+)